MQSLALTGTHNSKFSLYNTWKLIVGWMKCLACIFTSYSLIFFRERTNTRYHIKLCSKSYLVFLILRTTFLPTSSLWSAKIAMMMFSLCAQCALSCKTLLAISMSSLGSSSRWNKLVGPFWIWGPFLKLNHPGKYKLRHTVTSLINSLVGLLVLVYSMVTVNPSVSHI